MSNNTKLIIRIICFALILSSSITALALNSMIDEENITMDGSDSEVTITVPYNAAPGVEQVTLLAVKGGAIAPLPDSITDSDIVYIDQQSSEFSSFTFTVDKEEFDEENQYIHIKLGGTTVDTPDLVTMKIDSTGYRVYGTVSNAADAIDSGDTGIDEELNTAWKTTVELRPSFLSETVITSVDVDPDTNTFELTDIENGTYVLEINRNGYLPRPMNITVNNGDISLGDKPLYAGDLNGDYMVNVVDAGILYSIFGKMYGDPGYNSVYEMLADGVINVVDCGMLYANFGIDSSYYGDEINFDQ